MSDSTIVVSPSYKSFGVTTKNITTDQTVSVTNNAELGSDGTLIITTTAGLGAPYSLVNNYVANATISPQDSSTLVLRYVPTALGITTDTLTITSNDPNAATYDVGVDGTCNQAIFSASASYYSFGAARKNVASDTTVSIFNSGNIDMSCGTITGVNLPFSVTSDNVSGATIAADDTHTFVLNYDGTATGIYTDSLSFAVGSDPDVPTFTLGMDGSCIQPVISISPTGKAWGTKYNLSTWDQTVTVINVGNSDMTVGTLTGPAHPYSLVNNSVSGATLAADASATFVLRYHPHEQGSSDTTVTIPNNDTTSTFIETATAVAAVTLTPTSYNFGSKANLSITDTTVTVANLSSGDSTFQAFAGFGAPYTTRSDNVSGRTIAGGTNATFVVRFAPTSYGLSDSTLTMSNNDSTKTWIVNGLSQEADISVSPANHSFGAKLVRHGAFAHVMEYCDVTCTNAGNISLKMQEIGQPSNTSFTLTNDNLSRVTLASGASGTIRVNQTPATYGDQSCTIIFNSTDPDTAAYHFDVFGAGLGGNA